MSTTLLTNHARTPASPGSGDRLYPFSWIRLDCDSPGEIAYVDLTALYRQGNNLGLSFQAGAASTVVVALTLDPLEIALNSSASAAWFAWKTLAASELASMMLVATAAKVTFTAANRLMIAGM